MAVDGEIAHDPIEIAYGLVERPPVRRRAEAHPRLLNHLFGMSQVADDAVGVVHQGTAMSHIDRQYPPFVAQRTLPPHHYHRRQRAQPCGGPVNVTDVASGGGRPAIDSVVAWS